MARSISSGETTRSGSSSSSGFRSVGRQKGTLAYALNAHTPSQGHHGLVAAHLIPSMVANDQALVNGRLVFNCDVCKKAKVSSYHGIIGGMKLYLL